MARPIESYPEPEAHWASATSNDSDIEAEDGKAHRLTRRTNLGRAGLLILFTLPGLTAGYALGMLGNLGGLHPSMTQIVKLLAGGSNTNITDDDVGPIDNSAREASGFPKRDPRTVVTVPAQVAASTASENSARRQVELLTRLLETNEAIWAEGYKAEEERSDGLAKDLAAVRAGLANRVAAETSARAEVAQMTKLLEVKETEWAKRLDAEREKAAGVAKDLATVRAELDKRIPAEASARAEVAQMTKLLEVKETEWAKRLDAEREKSAGVAKDLATVRAELDKRIPAEASARTEVAQMTKLLEAKETEWAKRLDAEREKSAGVAKDLAAVRTELDKRVPAEASARTEVAQMTKLLEAKETEWAKRLDAEREKSAGVAKDLATVRTELDKRVPAEASARTEVAQMTKLLEAKETEWAKRLDAEREKSAGVAKDLATVQAKLANRVTAEASAGTEVAQMTKLLEAKETEWTKRLDAEREKSAGVAKDLATVRAELADRVTAEASARTTNDLTTNIKTESATPDRLKAVTVPDPLQMTVGRGASPVFTTDEARLIARAEFLIGQGDVAGARRFLERAVEGHSARAAFLLAETYDSRILRTLQVYGVRGDTQKALELYGMASEGGIDKAKERMSALKGAERP